ncbi:GNAT family N-acetyltransferase [Roseicitreum antarcticum]|uniref:Ribosomal protein S18 acetylase RimI n=1 Tax=Roseicitreum antarcticum TaxID=564137 RepID=A0A1H2R9R3_9RHOB|nr:GNAT family N-acetyltransferase [Roseicitreum antarcticum]SDW15594.1 Ribosomal protein S18 acetylase RimI [Roseicitreum antarcticum]
MSIAEGQASGTGQGAGAHSAAHIFAALDATWPAARVTQQGPWLLRDGQGGGQRVSATLLAPGMDAAAISADDVTQAEGAQAAATGQPPLFALRGVDHAPLDALLAARGYVINDPTVIYAAPTAALAIEPGPVSLFPLWPPLAIMRDLWAAAGTGPARLAVMERACAPKAGLIARQSDRAVGVGFVACHDGIAMLHAVEVSPAFRRQGIGARIVTGAAWWAQAEGATTFALAVTAGNAGARALYARLGMTQVASYHYRLKSA